MEVTPPSAWATGLDAITFEEAESALKVEAYSGAGTSMLE
jgi:hypothetical protein